MQIQLKLVVIMISLFVGAVTVLLANRLMKRYPVTYMASYFYFLVFLYIFSVYSVIGSQAIHYYLSTRILDEDMIYPASRFLIALGMPFLVLSWFMQLRMSYEMFGASISRLFMVIYFAVFFILFVAFVMFNLDILPSEDIAFMSKPMFMGNLLAISALGITFFASGRIVLFAPGLRDRYQRKAFRWFAVWYVIYILLSGALLNLSVVREIFSLLFMLIFMGFHLLPVLYLNNYLQQHYVAGVENQAFPVKMEKFAEKYGITKREREIIELICKGLTNQEISDSLYISLQTVKDHVHAIFVKTGVSNRIRLRNLMEE